MRSRNFISAIAFVYPHELSEFAAHFSVPKWLIYILRSHRVLRTMNQTNGTGDLDCQGVICLFMCVSISRESRFPRDYLVPRSGTLRVIGIYYTLQSASYRVFVRLVFWKCRYSSRFRSSSLSKIPKEDFTKRIFRVIRGY